MNIHTKNHLMFDDKKNLEKYDPEIAKAIKAEVVREEECINLIASENYTYKSVMEAQGSILTNKYAEGYAGKRYYGGCGIVDEIENIASERLRKIFKCEYVNTQPPSGTTANLGVFFAFLKPQDTILSMSLSSGGHLTHGSKVSLTGKWFNAVHYNVHKETMWLDYNEIESLAIEHKPKLIIAGYSAYSRIPDWKKFRQIADKVGAYLMCDIAHIAGLIAGGQVESPVPYADVVTSTTHKTLRGPRGGIVMSKDKTHEKILNSAVFPGTQGGPLMHVIAGKAVCFKKALEPEFKDYSIQVIANARHLAKTLMGRGMRILTDGTDSHLMVADLTKHNVDGIMLRKSLELANIIASQNTIPFDPKNPMKTSGIRFGSPSGTTRGFKEAEFEMIGGWIYEVLLATMEENEEKINTITSSVKSKVLELCSKFPIYTEERD